MKRITYISLFLLVLCSCEPKDKAVIYLDGKCNIKSLDSNQQWLRNSSTSEIITFTIQQTIVENNTTTTFQREIAPGDNTYLGCDLDGEGHKKYEVVGAYYGKKK